MGIFFFLLNLARLLLLLGIPCPPSNENKRLWAGKGALRTFLGASWGQQCWNAEDWHTQAPCAVQGGDSSHQWVSQLPLSVPCHSAVTESGPCKHPGWVPQPQALESHPCCHLPLVQQKWAPADCCCFAVALQRGALLGAPLEVRRTWGGERTWLTGGRTQRSLTSNSALSFCSTPVPGPGRAGSPPHRRSLPAGLSPQMHRAGSVKKQQIAFTPTVPSQLFAFPLSLASLEFQMRFKETNTFLKPCPKP